MYKHLKTNMSFGKVGFFFKATRTGSMLVFGGEYMPAVSTPMTVEG